MKLDLVDNTKRRPWSVYVAVVATAAIAAFLFFYTANGRRQTIEAAGEVAGRDSIAAIDAVSAFAAFSAAGRGGAETRDDREYAAEGMRKLASALYVMTRRDSALAGVRYAAPGAGLVAAASLTELNHGGAVSADIVHARFIEASDAIADIQQARYPQLTSAVHELREAANAIRPDLPLESQTEAIQRFFDRASDALRGMVEVGL